jgi:hypothetical protein
MTGEKLSEIQVTQAITDAFQDADVAIEHFSLVPVPGDPSYYLLLTEQELQPEVKRRVAASVDRRLSEVNCEYEDRRASQRLGPAVVGSLPAGSWAEHRRQQISRQGADAYAYKHPFLAAKPELAEQFRALATDVGQ